jgi:exosortase E/protease (VPEID-CTERM system)
VLLAGVLFEGFAISVSFESPAASEGDHWWVRLAAISPELVRISTAACAVFLLLLAPRLETSIRHARQCAAAHRWQTWLLLHVVSFAALYVRLAAAFGDRTAPGQTLSSEFALCEGLAIATVFSWFLALAPPSYWRAFVGRERLTLLAAVATATVAWVGGEFAERYWEWLASGTLILAKSLLLLAYQDVLYDPTRLLLGTTTFVVHIAPQCSGYEGVSLITVFLAIYLWLFRAHIRFPHALLLFPIGALAAWLANVVRIALLVSIGTSYSPKLAAGGFHSQAGWITFIVLAVAIIAVTHRVRILKPLRADGGSSEINPTAAALLVPFLFLMSSMIVTAAFTAGFDRLYPLHVVAMSVVLLWFRRVYERWDWSWTWPSVAIGLGVFVLWMVFERFAINDKPPALSGNLPIGSGETWLWVVARVVGSVLLVPLVEEMAFRGYLLRRLAATDFEGGQAAQFSWTALLLSSTAFGLLHGRWLAGTVAGACYALAFYRSGKLGDAVMAHITTNGLIALTVLVTGTWSLWS